MENRQLVQLLSAFMARRKAIAILSTLLTLSVFPVQAATRYWDGGNADIAGNGNGDSEGGSGTWNTTLKNWDQGSGLARVAWTNGGNSQNSRSDCAKKFAVSRSRHHHSNTAGIIHAPIRETQGHALIELTD